MRLTSHKLCPQCTFRIKKINNSKCGWKAKRLVTLERMSFSHPFFGTDQQILMGRCEFQRTNPSYTFQCRVEYAKQGFCSRKQRKEPRFRLFETGTLFSPYSLSNNLQRQKKSLKRLFCCPELFHHHFKHHCMQENGRQDGQRSRRGFAAMSPERQREIASQGGRAAHQQGVAHEWSAEEARAAGRKGGQASGKRRSNGREAERGMVL